MVEHRLGALCRTSVDGGYKYQHNVHHQHPNKKVNNEDDNLWMIKTQFLPQSLPEALRVDLKAGVKNYSSFASPAS